jgi:arsenate-mycothiol transferase
LIKQEGKDKTIMKLTILFLCPHNAAKSVMAAVYCQQLATEYGLNLNITSAGTEPDAVVSAAVAQLLQAEGLDVTGHIPRQVTDKELETAHLTISMGCDIQEFTPKNGKVEYWDDVPPPSQALIAARDLIYTKVEQLVSKLKREQDDENFS